MAITYPVSPESRWAVYRLPTEELPGEITSRNKPWPRADGGPIVGLDPSFVYLLHITATPPDYDSRVYSLDSVETVDVENNELRRAWTTEKRPTEEQIVAAENVEAAKNFSMFRLEREAIETRLMLTALIQHAIDGQSLPQKVRTMATEYATKGVRIYKNRDRLREIIADINDGQEPDLDAGWEEDSED